MNTTRNSLSLLLVLVVPLLLASNSGGQESVGFRHSEDTRSILEYRLPEWGYTTLSIDLGGNGRFGRYERRSRRDHTQSRAYAHLNPDLLRYRESEKGMTDLRLLLDCSWNRDTQEDGYPHETTDEDLHLGIDAVGKWNRYFRPGRFWLVEASVSGDYRESSSEALYEGGYTEGATYFSKQAETTVKVGLGVGRVRCVTPVIRALRFNERLHAIGDQDLLSVEEVQVVAEEFARRPAYISVFDRLNRHWWGDLFERIGDSRRLTPSEIFYLADVLEEEVGTRYEGWDISSGLRLYGFYVRNEAQRMMHLAPFARGRWYRNPTLAHQLGVEASGYFGPIVSSGSERDWSGGLTLDTGLLWVVSDRILWDTGLAARADLHRYEASAEQDDAWLLNQFYNVSSDFTFFVEDRVSITAGTDFTVRRQDDRLDDDSISTLWVWSLSMTYHIDRHLLN